MSALKKSIIDLKKQDKKQREISNILGCSEGYVSRIVKDYGYQNNIDDKFIGKTFGMLTPVKRIGKDKYGHAKYLCVCSCGKSYEIIGNSLDTGNTSSCGCSSRKVGQNHGLWSGYKEISSTYFNQIKKGASERNLDFSISIEDMWDLFVLQKRRCALSGITLMFAPTGKTRQLQTASLDRIDNSKGYVKGNIQWVHKHLNNMKMTLSNDDFIKWCLEVTNYQNKKKNEINGESQ